MSFLKKLTQKFKYEFIPYIKNNWFSYAACFMAYVVFMGASNLGGSLNSKLCEVKSDRPNCYIFYGIAQNDISKDSNRLKINYLIEGFPNAEHKVFVNMKDHNGVEDFLYSELHSNKHKAHYAKKSGQRKYSASYKIPKTLKPGVYWLQVEFDFKVGILGSLKPKKLSSNWMKFYVR